MSEIQRLQDAFLKADKAAQAGDEQARKDAAMFAKEIRRIQTQGAPSQDGRIDNNSPIGQFNKSVAGALNVLRTPAALADMGVNAVSRAVTGENLTAEPRSTEEVFRSMDIAVADERPQTVMQGLGRGAGDAVALYAPVVGVLNAARGAVTNPAIVNAIDDALRGLAGVPGLAAEVAAGAGAGAAGRGAEQAGYPELAPIAELAGGVGAGVGVLATGATARGAGTLAGKTPLAGAAIRAGRELKRAVIPMTEGGAREVARTRLQDISGGPERANELGGRIDPNDEFGRTGAQQTGDPNLLGLERAAIDENPAMRERLDARRATSETSIVDAVRAEGGEIGDARQFFNSRLRGFRNAISERVDRVISGADETVQSAGPRNREDVNSVDVVNRLKMELDDQLQQEGALWSAVPEGEAVGTSNARSAAASFIESTPRAQQGDIPRVVRQLLADEGGFGEQETVSEMHGLYSELRRIARSAMAGNDQNKNLARIANGVADAILEDLGTLDPSSDVGRAVNEARAFSRALHEKFDQGAVGRILKRTIDGDETMTPEAALDRTVGRGGAAGMADARKIEGAAPATAEIQDYLRGRFSEAIFNASEEFTPKAARTWMRNNAELLSRYPGLRSDLTRALQSRDAAQAFSIRAEARSKLADQGTLTEFNRGQPEKAINSILGADNPVKAARSIAATARKDQTGQALAGVKGAFTDFLTQDGKKLPALLSDPKTNAAMSEVFNAGEMRRLRQIGEAMERMNVQARDVGQVIDSPANKLVEMIVRIAAAQRGGSLGGGSMGGSLQTANIFAERARTMLRNLTNTKARELLTAAVEDPALMKELLMEPESWVRGIGRTEKSRLAPYLTGAATQVGNDDN